MFNKNFYPTPRFLICRMLEGIDLHNAKVLEPSAGKGDILDCIMEKLNTYHSGETAARNRLFSIEQDKSLQSILKEKKYKVISDDFLNYNSDYYFDFIIMNPPFDNGDEHLLKAIEISNGAGVVCLLNAETIKNPYSSKRQLLIRLLEEKKATIEFLQNAFSDAERKTTVEVALIKIKKEDKNDGFKFNGRKESLEKIKEYNNTQVASLDVFENMEHMYNRVKALMKEMLNIQSEMEFYGNELLGGFRSVDRIIDDNHEVHKNTYYNNFLEDFRNECWSNLFRKTKLAEVTTKGVRENFNKMQKEQGVLAFTRENMKSLFEELFLNQENIMQISVEESFDLMTKYYKENRLHIEGWKTNDRWKVNKKVILPNSRDSWEEIKAKLNYGFEDILDDIEKGLCFVSNKKIKDIKKISDLFKENSYEFGEWYESEFFKFKMFKKGTLHLQFLDDEIYEKFNITACKFKQWLGN